jgi:N6-L-threonylcarbamoyladenine synthase
MGIMRRAFYSRLKEEYENAGTAYGYTAKNENQKWLGKRSCGRREVHQRKPKINSAGSNLYAEVGKEAQPPALHKATINKCGKRKLNQAPKYVHGHQLFDRVQMPDGRKGFIFRRRSSGSFGVRALDGAKLSEGTGCKKHKPLEKRKTILTERGVRLPPHA